MELLRQPPFAFSSFQVYYSLDGKGRANLTARGRTPLAYVYDPFAGEHFRAAQKLKTSLDTCLPTRTSRP
jgi:hypothetical protein